MTHHGLFEAAADATSRPHASNRVAADDATTSPPHDANCVAADDATTSRPHDANHVAAASLQDEGTAASAAAVVASHPPEAQEVQIIIES